MPMPSLLMVEFLKWVSSGPRTYDETMAAWRSTCPRLTIWEDAVAECFVEILSRPDRSEVCLTPRGAAVIDQANGMSLRMDRLSA